MKGLKKDIIPRGITIYNGVFNQPIIKSDDNDNLQVSISYSHNVVVAIAFNEEFPCAIDIEMVENKNRLFLLKYAVERQEQKYAGYYKDESIFLITFWTLKEALSKVLKVRLTTKLSLFQVNSFIKRDWGFEGDYMYFNQYRFFSTNYKEFIYTIVYPKVAELIVYKEEEVTIY